MVVSSSITPLTDLLIPSSSPNDVVVSCQIEGGDTDYTTLWELSGRQLSSNVSGRFIINDSADGRSSTLTVTESGRRFIGLELISVECHADNTPTFRVVEGKQVLHIVQFGKITCITLWACHFGMQYCKAMELICRCTRQSWRSGADLPLRD